MLRNNIAVMQIVYSFYQYVINAVKFRKAIDQGKVRSERDAFSYGYYFVKEFYSKRDKLKLDDLMNLNSKILDIEFKIKS